MATSRRFINALVFAAEIHQDQTRKVTGEPYISHLMAVSAIVMKSGGDEDQAIAALLHDAVEDQPATLPDGSYANPSREYRWSRITQIESMFGAEVADIVEACSDSDGVPPKAPWAKRKAAFIEAIPAKPESSLPVIAADKIDNARAVLNEIELDGVSIFEGFKGGHYNTVWYYHEVFGALAFRIPLHPLIIVLGELVDRLLLTLTAKDQVRLAMDPTPKPSAQ